MAPPVYKLYTPEGSFRALASLIAAEYNGVEIDVVTEDIQTLVATKSPTGKAPFLETPSGDIIFSSHSIARFIAGLRNDTGLLGTSYKEQSSVDAWIDWSSQDVELPACVWFYPVAGYIPYSQEANKKAQSDLAAALKILNDHMDGRKYVVNDQQITLADITLAATLLYPFKFVCDKKFLEPYGHVVRWFEDCVSQPEFASVIGKVEMCKKSLTPPSQQ